MKSLILALLAFSLSAFAQTPTRYFEHKSKGLEIHISLNVEGDSVSGTKSNGSGEPETHGAYGTITGNVRKDSVLHVTFNYEIEGNQQSEEQLLKLDGSKLLLGDGELEEHGPGQMVLKEPKKVKFERVLKEIPLKEVALDTDAGKALAKTLQGPIAKFAGAEVKFDGTFRTTQKWARFIGNASVVDGQKAKDETKAKALTDGMLRAYLKEDGKDGWKVVRYSFEGVDNLELTLDDQDMESQAPWPLDEDLDNF